LNQFCEILLFQNGTCKDLPVAGQNCTTFGKCKLNTLCNSDNKCVEYFTVGEGGKCSNILECKAGYECYLGACTKPVYHFLSGPGIVWGGECDPSDGSAGCRCNYGSKIYMYLKEVSNTFSESCGVVAKELEECLKSKGCSGPNAGADTCMRKNCINQYNNAIDQCYSFDPTLRVPHCGASHLVFVITLLVVFMLL